MFRDVEPVDRRSQRDEHGVSITSGITEFQLIAPPAEQFQRAFPVTDFVSEVIRPSAEGIYIVEMLMQPLWQQPRYQREVFVVTSRQRSAISVGIFERRRFAGRDCGRPPVGYLVGHRSCRFFLNREVHNATFNVDFVDLRK